MACIYVHTYIHTYIHTYSDIEEKISKSSFNLHLQFTMPKERSRSKQGTRKSHHHLENDEVLQNESEGQSRGNARRNRSTGTPYRRPTRDYTKSFTWAEDINRRLYKLYLTSEPTNRGYQKRLKELWDEEMPERKHFTSQQFAQQVKNIKIKKLLNDAELQALEKEYKTLSSQEQSNSTTYEEENGDHRPGDDNLEREIPSRHEQELHTTENENNESVGEGVLKEEIREIWKRNFGKYITTDISKREYNVNIK